MSTINLAAIMDAIAARAVAGNVVSAGSAFGWPINNVTPPAVVVGYPTDIRPNTTFKGASHELVIPVWFIAGAAVDLSSRNAISAALDGATGLRAALEGGGGNLGGTVSDILTEDGKIVYWSAQDGTEYVALRFDIEVLA